MKNFDNEKYKCIIERKKVEREYKSRSFVTKKKCIISELMDSFERQCPILKIPIDNHKEC